MADLSVARKGISDANIDVDERIAEALRSGNLDKLKQARDEFAAELPSKAKMMTSNDPRLMQIGMIDAAISAQEMYDDFEAKVNL